MRKGDCQRNAGDASAGADIEEPGSFINARRVPQRRQGDYGGDGLKQQQPFCLCGLTDSSKIDLPAARDEQTQVRLEILGLRLVEGYVESLAACAECRQDFGGVNR